MFTAMKITLWDLLATKLPDRAPVAGGNSRASEHLHFCVENKNILHPVKYLPDNSSSYLLETLPIVNIYASNASLIDRDISMRL